MPYVSSVDKPRHMLRTLRPWQAKSQDSVQSTAPSAANSRLLHSRYYGGRGTYSTRELDLPSEPKQNHPEAFVRLVAVQ